MSTSAGPAGGAAPASRFVSNIATLLFGGIALLSAFAFGYRTATWIALGAGCVVVLTVLAMFLVAGRGAVQRFLDVVIVCVGAWTIIASRVFAGATVNKWLTVADGLALFGLGFVALVAHEASLEHELRDATRFVPADGRALNGAGSGARIPAATHERAA